MNNTANKYFKKHCCKIKEINYKYTICSCELLVFQFSVLFFANALISFMSFQIRITFPLKKNQSEPTLAVPEVESARTTKRSIDLLSGTELGNFMESSCLFLDIKVISIPTAKLSRALLLACTVPGFHYCMFLLSCQMPNE